MGKGDLGLDLRAVIFADVGAAGVGITFENLPGPLRAFPDIVDRLVVRMKDSALSTRLDGHIGHGETPRHGEAGDRFAREFHRLVAGAVDADVADRVQDEILSLDPGMKLSAVYESNRFGHLEPDLARDHDPGEVGTAHPRGKGAQGAVGHRVAVCADDEVARDDEPLFRQQGMFDPGLAHVIEMRQAMLLREIAHDLDLHRRRNVLVGREMIHDEDNAFRIEEFRGAAALKFPDRDRRGNVVSQRHVDLGHDELSRLHRRQVRVLRQDFFRYGHGHAEVPPRLLL